MAATQYYYFSGTFKWAQNLTRLDEKFESYKVNLILDEESRIMFDESGMQNQIKADKEGDETVTLRRRHQQLLGKELKTFGPPKVVDKDGVPVTESIGNGTKGIAKVAVFNTRNGMGHRLESVMVTDLVVFEGSSESSDPPEEFKPSVMDEMESF